MDGREPKVYDTDAPVCKILEDSREEICSELEQNSVPCNQRRWSGKLRIQVDFLTVQKSI